MSITPTTTCLMEGRHMIALDCAFVWHHPVSSWFQSASPPLLMTPDRLITDKMCACVSVCVSVYAFVLGWAPHKSCNQTALKLALHNYILTRALTFKEEGKVFQTYAHTHWNTHTHTRAVFHSVSPHICLLSSTVNFDMVRHGVLMGMSSILAAYSS